jgi:pimeloyl-ACP methyl ester carboxylesterase
MPNGLSVAWYDLGGDGPPLLLVHATGFCAGALAPMAALLTARFHCVALDQRAHGASESPPDGNFSWHGFAEDALSLVEALGLDRPFAFGHSSGGAAILLAEEAKPGTFAGLYCYEPVVFPGEIPLEPSIEANPLAVGALRRRAHFSSRAEALANFSSRPPFNRLDPAVLAAYVDNGFEPDPAGGIQLRCRREDEAQVYAQFFSHDAYARLGRVRCPVTLACGAETDAIGPDLLDRFVTRLAHSERLVTPGLGHFGPLEDPALVAASVLGSRALGAAGPG